MNGAAIKTTKNPDGTIFSADGAYWFMPATRTPYTKTVVRYRVVRRSDRVIMCSGTTVSAAARILAAKLASS